MTYSGMTVNERLWITKQFKDYEKAVKNHDTKSAIKILRSVELTDDTIVANLNIDGIEWSADDFMLNDEE